MTMDYLGCIYMTITVLVTLYQGYRGFMFQWILADRSRWTTSQRIVLLCLHDCFLYMVSTASGFVSFFLDYRIWDGLQNFADIDTGTAVLIVSLALLGILGVTGQLPPLIQEGKLVPKGG